MLRTMPKITEPCWSQVPLSRHGNNGHSYLLRWLWMLRHLTQVKCSAWCHICYLSSILHRDKTPSGVGSIYTKVTIHLLFDPFILFLEIYPTETPEKAWNDVCVRTFIVALLGSQISKQLTCPAIWISSMSSGISHNGVRRGLVREWGQSVQ